MLCNLLQTDILICNMINAMPKPKQRRVRTKSPVVYRVPLVGTQTVPFPGHDGPRTQLSFVLKTLAGNDSGMTKMHLSISRGMSLGWRIFEGDAAPQLADTWIDSGKSGEGENIVDNPSRRNVSYFPPQTPPNYVNIGPDGETPIADLNSFSLPVGSSISDLFYQLVGNEARWPEIHDDGTQSLKEVVFGLTAPENVTDWNPLDLLHEFGMKVAMYWFAKLLDSPFSRQLARCDDCGAYFAYERAPRTDIKGGIHCASCKGRDAARRMKSSRDTRTSELVGFAADLWEKWKPKPSFGSRPKWVAEQVNKHLRDSEILKTGRWVTTHLKEIEAEVERRKDAKG
jgi:hypothetical protein